MKLGFAFKDNKNTKINIIGKDDGATIYDWTVKKTLF